MFDNINETTPFNEIEEDILSNFYEESESNSPLSFNPKDIDIDVKQQSLDVLISRIRDGAIDMNTAFQRNGNLWTEPLQRRLIESILMGMPLPAFYFDASDKNKWLIVDGLQRLHTLKNFVLNTEPDFLEKEKKIAPDAKPLVLKNLQFLREFDGFTYNELHKNEQRTFKETSVTVYLIKPGTPEQVKYELFSRINTGGLMLNLQEIRHALNEQKNSVTILNNIVTNPIFIKIVNISSKRMQAQELVLRYFAFRLTHYSHYRSSFAWFLNDAMRKMNDTPIGKLEILASDLIKILELCATLLGKYAFSQAIIFSTAPPRITFNRALFEVLTVNIAELTHEQRQILGTKQADFIESFKTLLKDPAFKTAISVSTSHTAAVLTRFKGIKTVLDNIIREK